MESLDCSESQNTSSACCRKNGLDSCRCGKKTQTTLKNAATCNRAEQMQENPKKKRFFCLLPQEPTSNNLRPMRAAKNKTGATEECRNLQPSGTNARQRGKLKCRQIQKRNASACCRKSPIISDRCGKKQDKCH